MTVTELLLISSNLIHAFKVWDRVCGMELDYCEIIDLPEPQDGADVSTLASICSVYLHLVHKFTHMLRDARLVKMCWMQEERIAVYAKRLAANQREYRHALARLRKAKMFNFCLRVRTWVLDCPTRRMKLRALIGEERIETWHGKVREYRARISTSDEPIANHHANPDVNQDVHQSVDTRPDVEKTRHITAAHSPYRRHDVGNWYRLPLIPRRAKSDVEMPLHQRHQRRQHEQGGMHRAMPAVVFWPDELVRDADIVKPHTPQPNIEHRIEHRPKKPMPDQRRDRPKVYGKETPKIRAGP